MTADPPAQRPRAGDWRLGVWRSYLATHASVLAELEAELIEGAGMSLAWYDVLLQLVEAPAHRLRMADLAERVLLSRSGLTRLVDRLVAAGLAFREPSTDDARGTYTVLTDEGMARFRRAAAVHLDGVRRRFLDRFTDDELRTLDDLLGRLE